MTGVVAAAGVASVQRDRDMIAHHRQALPRLEPDVAKMNPAAKRAAGKDQRHDQYHSLAAHRYRSLATLIASRTRIGAVPPKLVRDATDCATLRTS